MVLGAGPIVGGSVPASASSGAPATHPARRVCTQPTSPKRAACLALQRTDVTPHLGVRANTDPSGYGPADLQSAYASPSATAGAGQPVAIIDAFDDPDAEADLATY